jgi:putative glutamine amidotransferase
MILTPRIAIPQPTTTDLAYNQRSWPNYADAVTRSGGDPVLVPLSETAAQLRETLRGCSGVLLPGSPADVDPARYGEQRDPATAPADPAREAIDWLLLDEAEKHGMPVLGVCFGVQSMNVWRGGSLVQDLTPMPVNHGAGGSVAVAHTVLVAPDSLLASLLTSDEAPTSGDFLRLPVNTSHHQAIGAPGDGLRIVARCPDDGVIEAVEGTSLASPDGAGMFHVEHSDSRPQFLLGVQWHPERSYEISAASRALFDRLIAEARLYADAH